MSVLTSLLVLTASLLQATTPTVPPEAPVEIAPNTFLIRATPMPGRGPDGNTVIIDAPEGLVVIDTGRHASQSDAILAFATTRKRPIAVIVNTHWRRGSERSRPGRMRRRRSQARRIRFDATRFRSSSRRWKREVICVPTCH